MVTVYSQVGIGPTGTNRVTTKKPVIMIFPQTFYGFQLLSNCGGSLGCNDLCFICPIGESMTRFSNIDHSAIMIMVVSGYRGIRKCFAINHGDQQFLSNQDAKISNLEPPKNTNLRNSMNPSGDIRKDFLPRVVGCPG